jgi:hypothetical protein
MINHFDLFGLRQVYLAWRAQPYTHIGFRAHLLYRVVRHPLMLGFIIAFWAAPTMTAGHLLFALATTGYILIALRLEEHDLTAALGDQYRQYRRRVPILIPGLQRPRRRADTDHRYRPAPLRATERPGYKIWRKTLRPSERATSARAMYHNDLAVHCSGR